MDDLEKRPKLSAKTTAVLAGAGVGGWIGSGIGIAGFFGAISGVLPVAVIGAYAAHRIYKAVTADDAEALDAVAAPPPQLPKK